MQILKEKGDLCFAVTSTFDAKYLLPIVDNLRMKIATKWDDYDEVYHANALVQSQLNTANIQADYHVILSNNSCVGIAMVSYGELDIKKMFNQVLTNDSYELEKTVVLNYFHISTSGRGNGKKWLKELIWPYYQAKGMKQLLVKSTHTRAFSLYEQLGKTIGSYQSKSDNGLYTRNGKVFIIE